MKRKKLNPIVVWIIGIIALVAFLYLMGFITQLIVNYQVWEDRGGISGDHYVDPVDWNFFACIEAVFSLSGLRIILSALVIGVICFGVYILCWAVFPTVCLALILLDAFGVYTLSTLRLITVGAGAIAALIPCFKEIKIGEISLKHQIEKQKEENEE